MLSVYSVGFATPLANREDLLGTIANITPHDTPFLSTAPRVEATHAYHSWLIDGLAATATGGLVEGGAFATSTWTARTRLTNVTQIFTQGFKTSNTQRAVDPAGVDDEYKYQAMKAIRQVGRNIEGTLFGISGACAVGTTAAARIMKRFKDFLKVGSSAGLKGKVARHMGHWEIGTTGAGAAVSACATAITEQRLNGMLQYLFHNGGNPDVLYCNAHGKRQISEVFTAGTIARRTEPLESKRLGAVVDIYETEFGLMEITLNRWVNRAVGNTTSDQTTDLTGALYAFERAMTRIAVLRPIKHVPMPPVGDSTQGWVLGELTLEVLNPDSCARAWGVSNAW
jgi:hypothetical protein